MQKRRIMILCSTMLLIFSLAGCAKKPGFTIGEWKGNTYENKWLAMQFPVPQDWEIATKEEINAAVGAGAAALDIEGTSAEQLKAVAELKSIFAFMVGDSNGIVVQLMYENLALTIGGMKYTETRYLDEATAMMLQQKDFQYEFVKDSSAIIAGKKFQSTILSLFEGSYFQEYYCFKLDQFMVAIIVSYPSELEQKKIDFINSISILK
jgi:hypothetical protein